MNATRAYVAIGVLATGLLSGCGTMQLMNDVAKTADGNSAITDNRPAATNMTN